MAEYAEPSVASGSALVVTTSVTLFTVVDTLELLLPATGSSVVADTFAVLLSVPADPGVTTIFTVAPAPFASEPRLHVTVAVPLHEPTVVLDETNVTPDGSASVTVTPAAASGPWFATASVHVNGDPTVTGSGESDFAIDRSASSVGGVTSFTVVDTVELLLPATGSSVVADTFAVLLNVPRRPRRDDDRHRRARTVRQRAQVARHRRRAAARADRRARRDERHPRRQHIGHAHPRRRIRTVVRHRQRPRQRRPDPHRIRANPTSRSTGRPRASAASHRSRSSTRSSCCCPPTGSSVVDETVAVLLSVPAEPGVTTIVTVAPAPFASAPRSHVTVAVPLHEPTVVLDETNVTPAGSTSVTVTPAAASGPWFATASVHVNGDPTVTGSGESDFAIDRSASRGLTVVVIVELLFPATGSTVVDETVAVLLN